MKILLALPILACLTASAWAQDFKQTVDADQITVQNTVNQTLGRWRNQLLNDQAVIADLQTKLEATNKDRDAQKKRADEAAIPTTGCGEPVKPPDKPADGK